MKPKQKLYVNCTKLFQKQLNFVESIDDDDDDDDDDKNDSHTEEDPEQIDHKLNRTAVSDSATLIGLLPIKAVGKRHWVKYSKQKVTESKKSLVGLVASACDIHENELFLIHQDAPNALT